METHEEDKVDQGSAQGGDGSVSQTCWYGSSIKRKTQIPEDDKIMKLVERR